MSLSYCLIKGMAARNAGGTLEPYRSTSRCANTKLQSGTLKRAMATPTTIASSALLTRIQSEQLARHRMQPSRWVGQFVQHLEVIRLRHRLADGHRPAAPGLLDQRVLTQEF